MTSSKVSIPTVRLNNGLKMPALGYGTWLGLDEKFEFLYSDYPKFLDSLSYAIDIGYRHIDTAHFYRVEPEIGDIVNKKIKDGVVKREEMFITTKIWNHDHKVEDVEKSARGSLRRLKMDYVDLLLMHWPISIDEAGNDTKVDYLTAWKGLENVLKKGLAKSIGVSNFNLGQMQRLLENCEIPPVCNQVEVNLTLGQKELVEFCQSKSVQIVAYSPFGAIVPTRATEHTPGPRLDDPTLKAIADKYKKTVCQIVLKYLYQRGIVSIPKSITKNRIFENASIFDFELESEEFDKIAKFDVNFRLVRPVFWEPYTYYPFDKVMDNPPEIPVALKTWKNGINQDIE